MVDPDVSVFWTVVLYAWPYFAIPVAFSVDVKLRERWILEDVSKPASGFRFKGANVQMVFTSRVKREAEGCHERSRWVDCTHLWALAVIIPAVFVCAAEWSPGPPASIMLVCAPFVFLAVFSLTLSQVRG